MNEKHIQQVLEIENQAQEVQEKARREAQEIPARAEQEAQALITKARAEADEEARKLIAAAQPADGDSKVAVEGASVNTEFEASAKKNFEKAVAFVLERVIGRA